MLRHVWCFVTPSSHFWFAWFAFPSWLVASSIFLCFYWLLACLSWENVCSEPLPIFKPNCLGLFFFCLICILDIAYCPLYMLWLVTKSCPTLVTPQWNSPGKNSRVGSHYFSRGSSLSRDQTHISCIAGGFFIPEPQGKPVCVTYFGYWCLTEYIMGKYLLPYSRWPFHFVDNFLHGAKMLSLL